MSDLDKRLEELVEALVDDRMCDERGGPFRGGCGECERFSNKGVGAARRLLSNVKTGAALAAALLGARKQLRYHRLALNEVHQAMTRAGNAVNVSFRFGEMDKRAGVVADDPELEELLR